ncbi:hypothetical protein ACP70R_010223 [Stipagrostis hirtigluma subsp. patula]
MNPGSTMERLGSSSRPRVTKKTQEDASIRDDVLANIFARLPTRAAMRCAALSRHHRQLIGDPDFWLLHRRVGPPPPCPHIAYVLTSNLLPPSIVFHEFHLAGHGGTNNNGLRRAFIEGEPTYWDSLRYVGTCNGVVLLAPGCFDGAAPIVLFNPTVAGGEEVVVEISTLPRLALPGCYRVSGFGYGPSSRRHKLLLARVQRNIQDPHGLRPRSTYKTKELLVCNLADLACPRQWRRAMLSEPGGTKISGRSVYLDGKIYLLADNSKVLAFDVDDETVTAIDLPGQPAPRFSRGKPKLMEMSGRLCVAGPTGQTTSPFGRSPPTSNNGDGSGAAYSRESPTSWPARPILHLYDMRTQGMSKQLHVPQAAAEQDRPKPKRAFCWGFQPTPLSPWSIVSTPPPPPPPGQPGDGLLAALNPVLEQDVKTGRERTLHTVCFMDMLLYIMRQLPDKISEVLEEFDRKTLG